MNYKNTSENSWPCGFSTAWAVLICFSLFVSALAMKAHAADVAMAGLTADSVRYLIDLGDPAT
ncbi:hypothetical protein, partial [Fulvivirga kasyanovii]